MNGVTTLSIKTFISANVIYGGRSHRVRGCALCDADVFEMGRIPKCITINANRHF